MLSGWKHGEEGRREREDGLDDEVKKKDERK
jgi:hypothetical protein